MDKQHFKKSEIIECTNCITSEPEALAIQNGIVENTSTNVDQKMDSPFIAPGLIDLQVNGIHGIDFNIPSLHPEDLLKATQYLLSQGVTTFFPTLVTNSDEKLLKNLRTIYQACIAYPIVNDCVWGIHLEGPFISPAEGAKGAHDKKYIKAPDWELFKKFQAAAGGKIKLITIAPEWEETDSFIKQCKDQGIIVSIGHSMANAAQIRMAAEAGAGLSTHLGNGVPLLLPRHPNIIWDQLASDELTSCIITDGIHIPDSFIKAVNKIKGKSTIIVSDATCFAGMPPGEYESHIGGTVIVDSQKRISLKNEPGLLAGAAKSLLENVEYLICNNIFSLSESWQMASTNVSILLTKMDNTFQHKNNDFVVFDINGKSIQILKVFKNGKVVYNK